MHIQYQTMMLQRLLVGTLETVSFAGRLIEHVLVPGSCAFCGGDLPPDRPPVCDGCHADMPWVQPRFHLDPFSVALAPLAYTFPVDAAIKRFKFRRKLFYAPAFRFLLDAAVNELPDDIDGLLPMPLHWRRQAFRGFNQAAEVCHQLRQSLGLPLVRGVRRTRATSYQSGLAARYRQRNVAGAFSSVRSLEASHILVVDDVVTTGATCRELGRLLLKQGIARVSVLAVARSGGS